MAGATARSSDLGPPVAEGLRDNWGSVGLTAVANLFWASLGVLQLLVLVLLTSPAGIFSNFMREMGTRSVGGETEIPT